jgi:asparagine synthase (glutamine-hydrolysing)
MARGAHCPGASDALDHFGVKPFYYYFLSGQCFVFASEIKPLLSHPEVPRKLNEVRVGEYLASMFDDKRITFYAGILWLPPAHCLIIDRDNAYAEVFKEILVKALGCRLRSAYPVGNMLSGGMDSSSVTCVARQLLGQDGGRRLLTFSAIFDEVIQCDERPFINTVLAQNGLERHYVHGDRLSPLDDLDRVLWHQDEAVYAPNLFLTWNLCRAAKEQGVRIILDGFDGDTTVSHVKDISKSWLMDGVGLHWRRKSAVMPTVIVSRRESCS